MNILLKKYQETEMNTNVGVQGKWKVEVVCPNGEIKKPLGDEWRPNMIQDMGLNLLQGQVNTKASPYTYGGSYGGIARTINGAIYGHQAGSITDDQGAVSYGQQLQVGATNTAVSTKVSRTCTYATDSVNGSRTITKIYDFSAVSLAQTIREVGIAQIELPSTTNYTLPALSAGQKIPIFSRFLIPGNGIVLEQFQFLRLTYSLQMNIAATVNGVPITISSNGFDGTGTLKCVGTFDNLFGKINGDGTPVDGYSEIPWGIIGRNLATNSTVPSSSASFIKTTQIGAVWDIPTFPLANTDFAPQNTVAGSTVTTISPGASTVPSSSDTAITIAPGDNSATKEATLVFPASNPITSEYIGGIFFRSKRDSSQITAVPSAGWYWQFHDSQQTLRPQFKDVNFALAVNLSQTISRI